MSWQWIRRRAMFAASAVIALRASAAAEGSDVVVRVVDVVSGRAVDHAAVALETGERGVSDTVGCATIRQRGRTSTHIDISREGYVATRVRLDDARAGVSDSTDDAACPGAVVVALLPTVLRADEQIVVSAARDEQEAHTVSRAVSVATPADLQHRATPTIPDAMAHLPGVFMQKTNRGAGSPYVRGLMGNHVLMLVDGIRLNNSTYRYGPNQYLATVSPSAVERIELVRGPGSVTYGSDALGGTLSLMTRQPTLAADGRLHVDASTEVSVSAPTHETWLTGGLDVRASRIGVTTRVHVADFGDVVAGGGARRHPSGYANASVHAALLARASDRDQLSVVWQFDRSTNVPRWDQVAQRGYAQYRFDPQTRSLLYVRWRYRRDEGPVRSVTVTAAAQQTHEGRDIARTRAVTTREDDRVTTVSGSIDVHGAWSRRWTWTGGTEAYRDRVRSTRSLSPNPQGAALRGQYPDGATALTAAAFARVQHDGGRWLLAAGTRSSLSRVTVADALFSHTSIARAAVVSEGSIAYAIRPAITTGLHVGQSFRAPNIDDMAALGRFDFGVEVPAPNLQPERATSVEVFARASADRVGGRIAAYRTTLSDLIDRVPAMYLGAPDWDGQRVYQKANVGRAHIHGFEAEGGWHVAARLRLDAHLTWTYGQNITRAEPMRRIAPLNGLVSLAWQHDGGRVSGEWRWAARQDRLASGDRADHRINPLGTPAWSSVDVSVSRVLRRWHVSAGVSNVFDATYRTHGSGIDAPGRTWWLRVRNHTSR